MNVMPVVDLGRQPAKATIGEPFPVSATVFREGHDKLGAEVVLTGPDGRRRAPVRMVKHPEVPDRYDAWVTPDAVGAWTFEVQAWSDPVATWQHAAGLKIPAGVDVELMFTEGRLLLERVRDGLGKTDTHGHGILEGAIDAAGDVHRPVGARLGALQSPELDALLLANPLRELVTVEGPYPAYADRTRALCGSWYEFFPRSEGATRDPATGTVTSGNFQTAAKRLDAVAAMGFDVIYLPPIHPIGEVNRKGPNNTLSPGPEDTGSPWAIGSKDGGHDSIHPDLGDFDDFDAFVEHARELGLEVALDLALQVAPDHPWVTSHPQWFTTRADGTIAYAENPPKKYQDIYPVNFDNDPTGICREVLRVVRLWMSHGVRIFRVDNPHTKPLRFWERLLGEIRGTDPDVLFLAEAFTRPAMMHTLAKIGFHQSYTYFTWRNDAQELEKYMLELSGDAAAYMRPNFFTNTPDILNEYLQHGGEAAFKIRAVLAAMLSPTWGIYSGYELCENVPIRPGSEEYMDSEKYQYRPRDWEAAARDGIGIADYITELNRIRRTHPALHQLRNLRFHGVDQPGLMCFSKRVANARPGPRDDTVLVVVNLDPYQTREATVWLDLPALGVDREFIVTDELTGESYRWGNANYVRLDPATRPAHVFSVTPQQ